MIYATFKHRRWIKNKQVSRDFYSAVKTLGAEYHIIHEFFANEANNLDRAMEQENDFYAEGVAGC